MINLPRRNTTWQHRNMTTIMTWHLYLLLELYKIAHGGIYIHIHMYTYQTITPKHISRKFTQPVNKEGYIARIWSTISHVASLGPKCFHCTLNCLISRFGSMSTFLCNIHWGSDRNYPSGSTCNTNHSITWSTSLTYFLCNDTWNTLQNFTIKGSAIQ